MCVRASVYVFLFIYLHLLVYIHAENARFCKMLEVFCKILQSILLLTISHVTYSKRYFMNGFSAVSLTSSRF